MLTCHTDDQGVATLTLNRPDVLNALSGAMIEALSLQLSALRTDAGVKVLLLTGAGRAFCAGADLQDPMLNLDLPGEARTRQFLASADSGIQALARALANFDKPVVAAVNGPAVGGGAALALAAHVVVAAESAYFSWPFSARLGLAPDLGASWYLVRKLGAGRALPLAMLGDKVNAKVAADWGLVWQTVADDELADTARHLAGRLAQGAPRALAALPALLNDAWLHDFNAQLDRERDLQAHLVGTNDFAEAVAAFQQKRPPRFHGR